MDRRFAILVAVSAGLHVAVLSVGSSIDPPRHDLERSLMSVAAVLVVPPPEPPQVVKEKPEPAPVEPDIEPVVEPVEQPESEPQRQELTPPDPVERPTVPAEPRAVAQEDKPTPKPPKSVERKAPRPPKPLRRVEPPPRPMPTRVAVAEPKPPVRPVEPTSPRSTTPPSPDLRGAQIVVPARPLPKNQPPAYPRVAIERGYQGTVELRLRILADGRVGDVRVQHSSGHGVLDTAAVQAVQRWRFLPATRNSRPVPCTLQQPVRFLLQLR